MRKITITVNGVDYPCRPTMGAMLRFKKETGRELSEMKQNDVSDMITFLWCCVVSASAREQMEFNYSLMDFADALDPGDLEAWSTQVNQSQSSANDKAAEKKS